VPNVIYCKRYRMEIDLSALGDVPRFTSFNLPDDYFFVAWDPALLEAHAETKYRSFCLEIDANVFPCLGDRDGCRRLMWEMSNRDNFLPSATWLIGYRPVGGRRVEYCGTVQGLRDRFGLGAVQNLGVAPEHRGRGLGVRLLHAALEGFRQHRLPRASLEVTAHNDGALRLYERLGFRKTRTVYKAVEVAYA
jgi:ribosomal protein S18 acetylase RimI-like enzyme